MCDSKPHLIVALYFSVWTSMSQDDPKGYRTTIKYKGRISLLLQQDQQVQ